MSRNTALVDLERLRYPHSGIAKVFSALAVGLSEMDLQDLDVVFYGPKENIPVKGFKNIDWKKHQKFNPFFGNRYPLVHVSHQLSSYFHHKPQSQRKIVTLHDLNFLHEDFSQAKLKRNIQRVNKNVSNADVVVCISEFVKEDYLKNRHLFSIRTEQKVDVIYNGLQFPEDRKFEQKFPFLNGKKYFLNVGVLFPKKNQMSLLKIISELEEDLVMVVSGGKKDYEKQVLDFIADNNLSHKVHILRNISDAEKYSLIQNCEALLHPSLAEGFGIPPIEAMYFGKPVFLSKLTSLPEIGGDAAFYFEGFEPEEMLQTIRNGIKAFSEDSAFPEKLKSHAKKFSYERMAREYFELYRKVSS